MRRLRRWWWVGVLALAALGGARLRFNVEVLDLLPADLPVVQGLKLYNEHFANARELLITVRAAEADTAEAAARQIAEQLREHPALVAEASWRSPWEEQPEQSAELFASLWLNQPPEVFDQLTRRLVEPQLSATLAAARARLATTLSPEDLSRLGADPLDLTRVPGLETISAAPIGPGRDAFASADGTLRVVFVQAASNLANYRECVRWLAAIQRVVAAAVAPTEEAGGVRIAYTGRPAFVAEIAAGMERDITASVGGTAAVIAVLFWLAHRRWRPLLGLLTLLVLVLGGTLAFGGLLLGTLSVMSVGFAAIVLGLAVDYGLVLYQEACAEPALTPEQVRRRVAPSIGCAALTTAAAFGVLNLSGLPGLGQLGSLVAIGVALAAVVMLNWYLPVVRRGEGQGAGDQGSGAKGLNLSPTADSAVEGQASAAPPRTPAPGPSSSGAVVAPGLPTGGTLLLTACVLLAAGGVLLRGLPRLDHSADSLRPRDSTAYATLDEVRRLIGPADEPLWLLIRGRTEAEVAARLDTAWSILDQARAEGRVRSFNLPAWLWPRPDRQQANRARLADLLEQRVALERAAARQGFTPQALALTQGVFDAWGRALTTTNVFWPTNELSRWVLGQLTTRTPTALYALGLVYPADDGAGAPAASSSATGDVAWQRLSAALGGENIWLTNWQVLGEELLGVVKRHLRRVLLPAGVLLSAVLALAFRRVHEVLLSLVALAATGLLLLAGMKLAGWSWNLMNLTALPLLVGMSVDYSIHMQWALRRHGGDLAKVRAVTGRALMLCAGTTMAGLGSLAWSSNAGMASLGQVCAMGIACAALVAVWLLPAWWRLLTGRARPRPFPGQPESPKSDAAN